MSFDFDFWKKQEGQTIDDAYPLLRLIAGSPAGAVYETTAAGAPAAIKLVRGDAGEVEARCAVWEQSAHLNHTGLLKNLAHGQTVLEDQPCAFLVMELAEENLADVLASRYLTPAEAADLLPPLLDALAYLHQSGFSHGRLKPGNILARQDVLKLSADHLKSGADPALDSRAVAPLLSSVLGTPPGSPLPEPLASWALPGEEPKAEPARARSIGLGLGAAALVSAALFSFWPAGSESTATNKAEPVQEEPKAPPAAAAPAPKAPSPKPSPAGSRTDGTVPPPPPAPAPQLQSATLNGVTQVLPEIPQQAKNTISGRVRINVRVQVDNTGKVTAATPEPPLGSKYFTTRVLAAALNWKFPPGNPPEQWILRFELTRGDTRVTAARRSR